VLIVYRKNAQKMQQDSGIRFWVWPLTTNGTENTCFPSPTEQGVANYTFWVRWAKNPEFHLAAGQNQTFSYPFGV
jgi:hypothetical protein